MITVGNPIIYNSTFKHSFCESNNLVTRKNFIRRKVYYKRLTIFRICDDAKI